MKGAIGAGGVDIKVLVIVAHGGSAENEMLEKRKEINRGGATYRKGFNPSSVYPL